MQEDVVGDDELEDDEDDETFWTGDKAAELLLQTEKSKT